MVSSRILIGQEPVNCQLVYESVRNTRPEADTDGRGPYAATDEHGARTAVPACGAPPDVLLGRARRTYITNTYDLDTLKSISSRISSSTVSRKGSSGVVRLNFEKEKVVTMAPEIPSVTPTASLRKLMPTSCSRTR
jgi:hypothetical protein